MARRKVSLPPASEPPPAEAVETAIEAVLAAVLPRRGRPSKEGNALKPADEIGRRRADRGVKT